MFKKILIANRGEIAVRIIRACRELSVQTVAIYSEADRNALHVRLADEAICVGPADANRSYRNIPNILSAADLTGAEAIHPGYGFLAEDGHFAEVCESVGVKFIGPSAEAIRLLGNKVKAREVMKKAGLPVVPGSDGAVSGDAEAIEIANKIGYPVIIKAVSGGGGRGIRVVYKEEELSAHLKTARAEGRTVCGDETVYIEKYFVEPRHIEVQVLADEKGKAIFFPERDCSIQRRHQKVVEESPSPVVDEKLRRDLGRAALDAVRATHYVNAGTVEFLFEKEFYFIEMNARIQVEHPVTEAVTGIDLVKEQIKIAAGRSLDYKQSQIKCTGHSIECRINAECPEKFTPSPGTISSFHLPGGPGVRVDTALTMPSQITPHYDPMIAKLIVHADNRDLAIIKMKAALSEFEINGIKTLLPLHQRIFEDQTFVNGRYSTRYIEGLFSSTSQTPSDSSTA
ncbi:MAG: acetyl-CoA carboxylase biotin carboxylase subunit [Nitrospirota bacterium]